jgi:hypothetical protein
MMSKFDEDDLGLPESPIYSNYSNLLWKAHTNHRRLQSPNSSQENTIRPSPLRAELPADNKPLLVASEDTDA